MRTILLITTLILLLVTTSEAVDGPSAGPVSTAVKTTEKVSVDGRLDEASWSTASSFTNFWMNFPSDSALASAQTEFKILYDDKFLYLAAIAKNKDGHIRKKKVASSLRRDFPFVENDAIGIVIDPFNDNTNGYGFYVSAYGVQRDEQIFNGTIADATWDTKWYSAVNEQEDGWIAEIAIPLQYLRFREDLKEWNINFLRNDISSNERSSWAATPRFFSLGNLAYHGKLQWEDSPKNDTRNISVIPSLTFSANQQGTEKVKTAIKPSLDATLGITPSLNLDVTINPDFSQAEADQSQLNLTRFELVFPEKRLFFIENSDLFSDFGMDKWGTTPVRPFYSRRIGLTYNNNTGLYNQTRVLGGLRVSGKLTKDLRVGIMSMQTDHLKMNEGENYAPSQNYSMVALQQKVFSRSNIGLILVNRQSWGVDSTSEYKFNPAEYSRLAGIDYNLASENGKWTGKLYNHFLFDDHSDDPKVAQGGLLQYTSKRTLSWIGINKVDKGYNPETGFVPRNGFTNIFGELTYFLYPKSTSLNFIQPIVHYSVYLDSLSKTKTDHRFITGFQFSFKNTAYIYALLFNDYTRLTSDFNPAQNDGQSLRTGSAYNYTYFRLYYVSDLRKNFSWHIYSDIGRFYNGEIYMVSGYLNRKIQPYGLIGINYNMNFIRLPKPYADNNLFLIGPKAEISISKSLFVNALVQYNTQNNNINYYGRIQWRFKPLSDLFIVYSKNQNMVNKQLQDQGLVVKLVYWL